MVAALSTFDTFFPLRKAYHPQASKNNLKLFFNINFKLSKYLDHR